MSMMLTLRRISDDDIASLLDDADEVLPLLRDVDGVAGAAAQMERQHVAAAIASVNREIWAKYGQTSPDLLPLIAGRVMQHLRDNRPAEVSRAEYLDLDQSWHILHTLITGSAAPSPDGIFGGEPVGPEGGYGPAHILRPAVVAALNETIAGLDVDILKSRVDREALREQSVTFAQTDFDFDVLEMGIEEYFPRLQKFIARTVAKKQGLLLILE